jgi:hypothetical protein
MPPLFPLFLIAQRIFRNPPDPLITTPLLGCSTKKLEALDILHREEYG